MRQQHPPRSQAVAVGMAHITAGGIQKAMNLALRMMKATGARPAIRAAENRGIAVSIDHAAHLEGNQIGGLVP